MKISCIIKIQGTLKMTRELCGKGRQENNYP